MLVFGCFLSGFSQPVSHPINNPIPQNSLQGLLDTIKEGKGDDALVSAQLSELLASATSGPDSLDILYQVGKAFVGRWEQGGKAEPAERYLSRAISLGLNQHTQSLKARLGLGILLREEGKSDRALQVYEEAVNQFLGMKRVSKIDSIVAGFAYQGAGKIYTIHGDYEKAVAFLRQSLRHGQATQYPVLVENAMIEIGTALGFLGNQDTTFSYYQEVLQLAGISDKNRGIAYLNLGSSLAEGGSYDQAKDHLQQAQSIFESLAATAQENEHMGDYQTFAGYLLETWRTRGIMARQQGQGSIARQAFEQALAYGRSAFQTTRSRKLSRVHLHLAEAHFAARQYEEAIAACQQALRGVLPEMKIEAVPVLPEPDRFYPEPVILEALELQANCFQELHRRDGSEVDLMLALRSHQLANQAMKQLRQAVDHESSKLLLADETHRRAEKALEVAYELYRKNREQSYWELAFGFAEQSKASLLMESARNRQARSWSGIPDSLLRREQQLQHQVVAQELRLREQQLQRPPQPEALAQAEDQLFRTRQQYNRLISALESDFPEYHQLKYNPETASLSALRQELLKPGEALLSYFYGDRFLYIFMLSQEEKVLIRQPVDQNLQQKVIALRQALNSLDEQARSRFDSLGFELYGQLLGALPLKPYSRLHIIPDRDLALLPFECLLTRQVEEGSHWGAYPFLIQDQVVSYAYSASLLLQTHRRARDRKPAARSFLGFAPARFGGTELPALPHTREEVERLERMMGGMGKIGGEAQKDAFLELAPDFQVLHLSTHAMAWDSLRGPWIALLEGQQVAPLRLDELAALRLQADLTVLSACETGAGAVQRGEGVMSLARAFTYAGSQATLQSLWPVRAAAAEPLMAAFYQNLRKGHDKAEALHLAKLELLESPALSEPAMWAAFVAIGDMGAVKLKPHLGPGSAWWLSLLLAAGLLGGAFAWRRRGKKMRKLADLKM
jgi:CHAT domain-containing protein/tetratricopeptide (TPR) repeat protein